MMIVVQIKTSQHIFLKDLDYDDDLTGIIDKIDHGTPSTRFNSITDLCGDNVVKCFGAVKTFEYALALEPNNIEYLLDARSTVYPEAGPKLRKKSECGSQSAAQSANDLALCPFEKLCKSTSSAGFRTHTAKATSG